MLTATQKQKVEINGLDGLVNISKKLLNPNSYPHLVRWLANRTGEWQPINHMDWYGTHPTLALTKHLQPWGCSSPRPMLS